MTLYTFAISVHIVTAILGLGQVAAIAVLASSTSAEAGSWAALKRLSRGTAWSLGIMMLSGVLVEYALGGPFHDTWWFRLSFLGVVMLGAINGSMGRGLRKRESVGDERTLKGVVRSAWLMCAITAVIAVAMEIKP